MAFDEDLGRPPEPGADIDLIAGFRFGVFFFLGGVAPNPLDTRFQKVSGLSAEISTLSHAEGGQNLFTHRLPERIDYGNLVLERGKVLHSPLNLEFDVTFSLFKFKPSNVVVTLFGEDKEPLAGWLFLKAYPVRWASADLDAAQSEILIDTIELAYTRMQTLRV